MGYTDHTDTLIGAATVRLSTESLCATHSGVSLWWHSWGMAMLSHIYCLIMYLLYWTYLFGNKMLKMLWNATDQLKVCFSFLLSPYTKLFNLSMISLYVCTEMDNEACIDSGSSWSIALARVYQQDPVCWLKCCIFLHKKLNCAWEWLVYGSAGSSLLSSHIITDMNWHAGQSARSIRTKSIGWVMWFPSKSLCSLKWDLDEIRVLYCWHWHLVN